MDVVGEEAELAAEGVVDVDAGLVNVVVVVVVLDGLVVPGTPDDNDDDDDDAVVGGLLDCNNLIEISVCACSMNSRTSSTGGYFINRVKHPVLSLSSNCSRM